MAFDDVKMGIKRPATLDEQLAIQSDIRAMRKAITFGQRDSALIQRCLRVAEHEGLSSEETYVLIAYHALCQVQDPWERELKLARLDIRQPAFMQPDNQSEK
jgi:hypothetical protein